MKYAIFIFSLCFFNLGFAQNATLTKGETIQYLDKMIKLTIGHAYSHQGGLVGKIDRAYVKNTDVGIEIWYEIHHTISGNYTTIKYKFNPSNLNSVLTAVTAYENSTNSSVNEIKISLTGNVCLAQSSMWSDTRSVDYANFLYLRADPANFERITKGLRHLQALYKAEDDPFDN